MTYDVALTTILDREPDPAGGVAGADVDYTADGTACRGYLARPAAASGPLPAVLVTHDWLGVTDYVRMRCDMLARLGYLAFAADVYGADTRPSEAEASKIAQGFYGDRALFRARMTAAFVRMLAEEQADPTRAAVIGYCFGGAGAVELARTGADLAAAVSFHGGLMPGDGTAEAIRAHLLVLTGASDPVFPDDKLIGIEDEFRTVPTLDWQVVTYSGAMHAFTVPSANSPEHGAQFDAVVEQRSWTAMKSFFAETLA